MRLGASGRSAPRGSRGTIVLLARWGGPRSVAAADHSVQPAPGTQAAPPAGRITPQHAYVFGEPAYWPATLTLAVQPLRALSRFSGTRPRQSSDRRRFGQVDRGVRGADRLRRREPPRHQRRSTDASVIGWQVPQGGLHGGDERLDRYRWLRGHPHRRCRHRPQPDDGDDPAAAGVDHRP